VKSLGLIARDLWRYDRLRVVAVLVLTVVGGTLEGLSMALLLPLMTHFGIAGAPVGGGLAGLLQSMAPAAGDSVVPLLLLLITVALVQGTVAIAQGWSLARLTQGYAAHWKLRLAGAFLSADWSFATRHKSGHLINAITGETGRVQAAAMSLLGLVSTAIVAAIYLAYGLLLSWPVTLLLLLAAMLLAAALSGLYQRSRDAGEQIGRLSGEQQVLVGECLQGIKAIKASALEAQSLARIASVATALERANRTVVFLPTLVRAVFETLGLVIFALLMVSALLWMNVAAATLLVVLALFLRLYPRLSSVQQYIYGLNAYAPSIIALTALATEAEARAEASDAPPAAGQRYELPLGGEISLDGLHAGYDGSLVLRGLSCRLPLTGFTAIAGGSGAGKSTLLAVLLRLIRPDRGRIVVGGRPIDDIPLAAWRRAIGFVPQETILFHASIRDNIALAAPEASAADVERAARQAHLHDHIASLPEGYDTIIGDQGVRLSGGQRQRLGLARALAGRPRLLLLDEPTSALDPQTEGEVLSVLRELKSSLGIILVAHRPATLAGADRVLVLADGVVKADGPWPAVRGTLAPRRDDAELLGASSA
jgi:ATP-binding cassette subfamily C protein